MYALDGVVPPYTVLDDVYANRQQEEGGLPSFPKPVLEIGTSELDPLVTVSQNYLSRRFSSQREPYLTAYLIHAG